MTLGELGDAVSELRKSWEDDTPVYIDFDCPRCYSLDEVTEEEDESLDCILLHTHPFTEEGDSDDSGTDDSGTDDSGTETTK